MPICGVLFVTWRAHSNLKGLDLMKITFSGGQRMGNNKEAGQGLRCPS